MPRYWFNGYKKLTGIKRWLLKHPPLKSPVQSRAWKKALRAKVYVNTRNYAAWIWRDKQCTPSNSHEYALAIREIEQNLLAEAGGWQEGAQLLGEGLCWCSGRRQSRRGAPEIWSSLAKGCCSGLRGETWSLGSLYGGDWEEEPYLWGRRWRWMTRLFRRVEERDTPILLETRVSGGAGWTAVLSSLGRFRRSPVPLTSLTRSS